MGEPRTKGRDNRHTEGQQRGNCCAHLLIHGSLRYGSRKLDRSSDHHGFAFWDITVAGRKNVYGYSSASSRYREGYLSSKEWKRRGEVHSIRACAWIGWALLAAPVEADTTTLRYVLVVGAWLSAGRSQAYSSRIVLISPCFVCLRNGPVQ